MIIDSHTHFGSILDFDLPKKLLLQSMDLHGISGAVVSNIEGVEFDHSHRPLPEKSLRSQTAINLAALAFAREQPGRIFPLFWAMPHTGGATAAFRQLVADHRAEIYGIKIHPYLNNVCFDSPLVEPYVKLAAEFGLPVVTHTAGTSESSPSRVARMARKYPEVRFLLVHMGLYTDHEESIDLILRYPNLYGDTTWVEPESTMKLIARGGADKILFGTDSTLGGLNGYQDPVYKFYLKEWQATLLPADYDKLMSGNAVRFFGIKIDGNLVK